MIKFMQYHTWERVVIVYSDNDYGYDSMTEFVRQSQETSICVAAVIAVPPMGDVSDYQAKLANIGMYDVNSAVIFATHDRALKVCDFVPKFPDCFLGAE